MGAATTESGALSAWDLNRCIEPTRRLARLELGGCTLPNGGRFDAGVLAPGSSYLLAFPARQHGTTSGSLSVRPQLQLRDSAGVTPDFPTKSAAEASGFTYEEQGLAKPPQAAENHGAAVWLSPACPR